MVEYRAQVLIIGGGATGVGLLRDLSMRGIQTILFEQGDLAHGTSSRFHGLLHSGARYAVKDPKAAQECIRENKILKKIAPHCIDPCGGWFVELEEDDPEYTESWLLKCREAGIEVCEIPLAQAQAQEPLLYKARRVYEVPDAAVDGFKLVWANAKDAKAHGGMYYTYHRVESLVRVDQEIIGARGKSGSGEPFSSYAVVVINAAGAWAGSLAATAGVELEVICDKGVLLAFNQRVFRHVINRLRPPGDGDIFVPHETITIFGTTSEWVDHPADTTPSSPEVEKLFRVGREMIPGIEDLRIIRAFAGVRPLYRKESEGEAGEEGRQISRDFALIDHESRQGIKGLLSIVGGKFTTYRLMAEKAADWVSQKIGNSNPCRTAKESLQPAIPLSLSERAQALLPWGASGKMLARLGAEAKPVLEKLEQDPAQRQMLCECELVSVAEVKKIVADQDAHSLADVRRKTRLGMGTCQGAFCSYRTLPLIAEIKGDYAPWPEELQNFLNQRWKGILPVLWGQQLRETELTRAIYCGLLRLKGSIDRGE